MRSELSDELELTQNQGVIVFASKATHAALFIERLVFIEDTGESRHITHIAHFLPRPKDDKERDKAKQSGREKSVSDYSRFSALKDKYEPDQGIVKYDQIGNERLASYIDYKHYKNSSKSEKKRRKNTDTRPYELLIGWQVNTSTIQKLVGEVTYERDNPYSAPVFQIGGKQGETARGHNCTSWAIDKLRNIGIEDEVLKPNDFKSIFAENPKSIRKKIAKQ